MLPNQKLFLIQRETEMTHNPGFKLYLVGEVSELSASVAVADNSCQKSIKLQDVHFVPWLEPKFKDNKDQTKD